MSFQMCTTFFLLRNTKDDILENVSDIVENKCGLMLFGNQHSSKHLTTKERKSYRFGTMGVE